ncbi:MAG: hypothetical protein DMG68_19515 [Acidobacteria bacterium]|nr:MAG: hypothetical protein DMG68_19515 [Acidobacteriota bacterium]
MAATLERRETGTSLMFIGLAVWVVSLLVLFFLPAGIKVGNHLTFFTIFFGLVGVGAILMISGYRIRR